MVGCYADVANSFVIFLASQPQSGNILAHRMPLISYYAFTKPSCSSREAGMLVGVPGVSICWESIEEDKNAIAMCFLLYTVLSFSCCCFLAFLGHNCLCKATPCSEIKWFLNNRQILQILREEEELVFCFRQIICQVLFVFLVFFLFFILSF